jgi:hypothetical protein
MKLEFIPLLQLQRDLYNIPLGQERFQAYLETMLNSDASDVELPTLGIMNPMGKAHIPAMLDALIAMDADTVASQAIAELLDQFEKDSGTFKLGLVVADDLMGGWTNRYTSEFSARFEIEKTLKRGWLSGILWTSEIPSLQKVREEALTTVYRATYIQRHGFAHTLQEMLNQEGYAMAMAGCTQPSLDDDDIAVLGLVRHTSKTETLDKKGSGVPHLRGNRYIAYTREIITPYLSSRDYPTVIVCLFGDRAAHSLGYKSQGLSERAGLALALHQIYSSDFCSQDTRGQLVARLVAGGIRATMWGTGRGS